MMPPDSQKDRWTGANAYEEFMGRWSRDLALLFVRWLNVPPGRHWLEVGCGTGALTARICEIGQPASVVATDPSEQYIAHAVTAVADPRVHFQVASVGELPPRVAGYDTVVSSLALNFFPDPPGALREMISLANEGGVIAACVWDYAGEMQFLRRFWDAAAELDPAARRYDEGLRFPICAPAALEAAFREARLPQPTIEPLEVETRFRDFDDYWAPFLGGAGPAPSYVASLPGQKRHELAAELAATLPHDADGSIAFVARAWAIAAEKPSTI